MDAEHGVAVETEDVLLDEFEAATMSGNATAALSALRRLLLAGAGLAEGNLGDAVAALLPGNSTKAVAGVALLRALGSPGVIREGGSNQLARNIVALVEGALPELCSFAGLVTRSQTYEKFAALRGVHGTVLHGLEALRAPYTALDTILSAKPRILSALNHGQLRTYCRPFGHADVAEAIEAVMARIARVQQMGTTLGEDVEACRREIAVARELASRRSNFLTVDHLSTFLQSAARALNGFLVSVAGRFVADITRGGPAGLELQKRYPLHEEERDLRVVLPLRNEGPGSATDVVIRILSASDAVVIANAAVSLGTVAAGEFAVEADVLVVAACAGFEVEVQVEWGEIGTARRKEDLFEFRVVAQRADIDWPRYQFWNPYSTEPAEGSGFYGRGEQVRTLVARILQTPMEPSYITGQKRVGKTSLARTATEEARRLDPRAKLDHKYISWGHVAHDDPRMALRQLGEAIEDFILSALPVDGEYRRGDYGGSLSPLFRLSEHARRIEPERRFVVIIDEFDELPQDLYLRGNLAETFFANLRALTTTPNICLILVGGEDMPFVMERQGQRLNKFNRVNLTYFSRATEWEEFTTLVQEPSVGVLTWHPDAVSEIFNLTNGNPYFTNIICRSIMTQARAERDGDVSAGEVRKAVEASISSLDTNAFIHLWEDGTRSPVDERETVILKRRRTLAALARCIRNAESATLENIHSRRGASRMSEQEFASLLLNFVDREVLVERHDGFKPVLPIFGLWLSDVGLNRLANDGISEELAAIEQRQEDDAHVRSEEIVELLGRWQPYRGRRLGSDDVRSWLAQRTSNREQRLLFTILKAVRVVGLDEIFTRLRSAGNVIRARIGVPTRRHLSDRRSDVVVTYVDGEGKSGQRYAGDYADENKISQEAILPMAAFRTAYEAFCTRHGVPGAIVIVDDIVATGESLSRNVKAFLEAHGDLLAESNPLIQVHALFATRTGSAAVATTLTGLKYGNIEFSAGEVLEPEAFAFAEPTGIFSTADEFERAKAMSIEIGSTIYPRHPLGWGDQALLVVLPTTVPNNTLPLLHSHSRAGSRGWRPLFERLTS